MSTIAAVSTPHAPGGISVIRISGEDAIAVADRVFASKSGKLLANIDGYTCLYGNIVDQDKIVDDCIATVFRAPHSYTGENVAELSCHGGIFITSVVLRMVFAAGAIPAEAGEFTRRAFLNGKMSLTEAEAVMDIINADNNEDLLCANTLHHGCLYKKIRAFCDECVSISADLAAWSDFPEEDIPEVSHETLDERLTEITDGLKKIAATYDYGLILKDGIRTVIVGKPNVGKSTFMNYLAGVEKSIVCDIPGTTRDIIEDNVMIGQFKLCISDTAGIRKTEDVIEQIGVERAFSKLNEAQLVLAIFDLSSPLDEDDMSLLKCLDRRKVIAILNKNDCNKCADISVIQQYVDNVVELSAKNKSGVEQLEAIMQKIFADGLPLRDLRIYVNERQRNCLLNAISVLENAIYAIQNNEFNDIIAVLIDDAIECLYNLTGENVSEAVVNEVFARFCVGK